MNLGLKGKTAIVTGGSTGIGAGISEFLASEGVNVAINYIVDKEQVQRFSGDLNEKYGTRCFPVYGDVSAAADNDAIVKAVIEKTGSIDILVNNAGIWPTEDMLVMPDENWKRVIDICLNGPYMLSKRVVNSMIDRAIAGVVINISSKSGIQVNTGGHGHYTTAKAGLNMMTKSLAIEVAKHGVRVVGIAPGMVRTPLNEDKWVKSGLMDEYLTRIPVGRFAEPEEIGYMVAFLASKYATNVTGTIVDCTGGMLT